MVCKECNKEKGCGCSFSSVPNRSFAVCPECKKKILEQSQINDNSTNNKSTTHDPNV